MSTDYQDIGEKTRSIRGRLERFSATLSALGSQERDKYPNPHLRIWSGDIRDLEGFAFGLEEWLNEPKVAEAKRYLADIRNWSKASTKASPDDIGKEWRFLSENLEAIGQIHGKLQSIEYQTFRRGVCTWVLQRIAEKDIERALRWATNANGFATGVKGLEAHSAESGLARQVRKAAVRRLLSMGSFDGDNLESVDECRELLEKADDITRNKPPEVEEKAMLSTYRKSDTIEAGLSTINDSLGSIRRLLVDLEWVEGPADLTGYGSLWSSKRNALKKGDLASTSRALEVAVSRATEWKETRRSEIDSTLAKLKRMAGSTDIGDNAEAILRIENKVDSISWEKPNLALLSEVLSEMNNLNSYLREQLVTTLQSEDAIAIVEEPETIADLGERKGWEFERFIRALEIVLRNGIVEIEAREEI